MSSCVFHETAKCCAPTEAPGQRLLTYPPLGGRPRLLRTKATKAHTPHTPHTTTTTTTTSCYYFLLICRQVVSPPTLLVNGKPKESRATVTTITTTTTIFQSKAVRAGSARCGRLPHVHSLKCETDLVIYSCLKVYCPRAPTYRECSWGRSTLRWLVPLRAVVHMRLYPHLHRAGMPAAAVPYPGGPSST